MYEIWVSLTQPHGIQEHDIYISRASLTMDLYRTKYITSIAGDIVPHIHGSICCLYFLQGGFPLPSWVAGKVIPYFMFDQRQEIPCKPRPQTPKAPVPIQKDSGEKDLSKKNNKHLRGLEDSPGRRSPPLLGNVWKRNHFLIETFGMANERVSFTNLGKTSLSCLINPNT